MDFEPIWGEIRGAVIAGLQTTIAAAFAFMTAWLWKRTALIKGAGNAAVEAENEYGPGHGEAKHARAKRALGKTLAGRLASPEAIDAAIDKQDFTDIRRRASAVPKPPD